MKLLSKFNFGDKVWKISQQKVTEWITCTFCAGTGIIIGKDNTEITCSVCYGRRGESIYKYEEWQIEQQLTIGYIRFSIHNKKPIMGLVTSKNTADFEEAYMCKETGIGTGTLQLAEDLWATKKTAQAECDKLNKGEKEDDNK